MYKCPRKKKFCWFYLLSNEFFFFSLFSVCFTKNVKYILIYNRVCVLFWVLYRVFHYFCVHFDFFCTRTRIVPQNPTLKMKLYEMRHGSDYKSSTILLKTLYNENIVLPELLFNSTQINIIYLFIFFLTAYEDK